MLCWSTGIVMIGTGLAADPVSYPPIKVPAIDPKWSLKFSIEESVVTHREAGTGTVSSQYTMHDKKIQISSISNSAKSFESTGSTKQDDLRYLRAIVSMAKLAAQKKDNADKEKEVPSSRAGAHSGYYFVAKSGDFFGKVRGTRGASSLLSIEEIEDVIGIINNWPKYEGEARKTGAK